MLVSHVQFGGKSMPTTLRSATVTQYSNSSTQHSCRVTRLCHAKHMLSEPWHPPNAGQPPGHLNRHSNDRYAGHASSWSVQRTTAAELQVLICCTSYHNQCFLLISLHLLLTRRHNSTSATGACNGASRLCSGLHSALKQQRQASTAQHPRQGSCHGTPCTAPGPRAAR
jgi:hypothetical protein